MCSTAMQLGSLTIDATPASVRAQAERLASTNPEDPRIALFMTLIETVRSHNDNARAAIVMFDELAKYERHEGYAYVRATLDELNQRNDVTRARLIKPYADFLSAVDECRLKGYLEPSEVSELRNYAPGGLGLGPFVIVLIVAIVATALTATVIGSIAAYNLTVGRAASDEAKSRTTRKVAEDALAILRDSGSTPEQQKSAKEIIEQIVKQPGGPLAPATAGFGIGLIVAGLLGVALFTRSNRRTA